MAARWLAFVVWALVAASAVFWLGRVAAGGARVPAHAAVVPDQVPTYGPLSRVLGEEAALSLPSAEAPAPVAESSRFRLVGVAAPRNGGRGVVLIAVDNKPPRAYRVGAAVDGEVVVQAVAPRSVALGPRDGPATVQLELPPLPPAATGSLPASGLTPPPAPPPATPLSGLQSFPGPAGLPPGFPTEPPSAGLSPRPATAR